MRDLETNSIHVLEESKLERDLGIYVSHDLKWSQHIQTITARASSVMAVLKKSFE